MGFGPSAHSYDGTNRRWNHGDMKKYLNRSEHFEVESLSSVDQFNEYLMTNLRLVEGVDLKAVENLFPEYRSELDEKLPAFVEGGEITKEGDSIRLSLEGMLICDSIVAELMTE